MSIVVIGSIAFDDVETEAGSVKNALGGSALYFSAAASLFSQVHLVGVVGEDFPCGELDFMRARGVNTDGLKVVKGGSTFRWSGVYETDMNKRHTTNLALNVFNDFDPVLNDECRQAEYVFLANIDPELQERVLDQMHCPKFVALDTMECYIAQKPQELRNVLKRVNLLFINDSEAQLLTGISNVVAAADALLDMGPEYIIIKKGEHGSLMASRDMFFTVPAYPIHHVVDPTGAGDSYAGGVMGYLARMGVHDSATLRRAVVYGGIVASFLVEGFSLFSLKDLSLDTIEERMTHFRSLTAF
ncbi:MAG: PfkB family carbohydrate kinase [Candidatus Latescibacterota bacterium]